MWRCVCIRYLCANQILRFVALHWPHLQQSLQVLALRVTGNRIGVGQIVAVAIAPAAGRLWASVLVHVAPVLELLLVVLEQHQRWEQAVAAAATVVIVRWFEDGKVEW